MYMILLTLTCVTVARADVSTDVQEWHIVRCLRSISQRYFSTGETLAMSLHEEALHTSGRRSENFTNWGRVSIDVVGYISEEIHRSESRSVVISNVFTDYDPTEWKSNHKPEIYLLLTPSSCNHESDIVQSVKSQLKRLSSYPEWNPRARFVVTVINISFKYNAEELSQRLLVQLWERKILNAIVLIPLTNTSQSQVATGTRRRPDGLVMEVSALGIYTWFPYQGPNQCSVVDEAVLLDMWLMEGEGNFVRNSFFFPRKAYDNFHGCELRVATRVTDFRAQNTILKSGNNRDHKFDTNFEIRLLKLITRTMNFTLIFLPQIKNFRKVQEESGKYIGYTGLLMNDKADIAVGGIIRSATSTNLTDVTRSYWKVRWQWFVPCPVKFPGWQSIFRIFSLSGWSCILLAAMLAPIVIVFLARFRIQENESFKRFMDAVLDVWALILGVSILSLPRTSPLRLFFSAWMCYSLAINTVFQAYLTTYLVDPGFEKSITSIEEVFTSGTKYGFSSTYFDRNFNDKANNKHQEILRNRIDCVDMVTCLLWTAKYRNISSICNPGLVEYFYYASKYSDKFRGSRLCELKEASVLASDLLMVVQKGSFFLDRMNDIICRLVESGISTYFNKFGPETYRLLKAKSSASKTVAEDYHALTMNNMQSAFYLLLLGHSLGLISFLMEMLYFKIHL
ncbi:hypothetical protein B7P43_G04165 [Cryptotermes secundus]|uniref:Ionotropic glutamate receptor C-terminal domain-containing protein n=1 Tax=Cryptotermes secundus TaxID=105785 RepID=A0A2J7QXT8_9NEOP|nr:hypothetical protein B7P43_G04165 [Cryptotermes secundus]